MIYAGNMTSTKRKFIVDTDAGIDDAQAILMALAYPEVEVVAITTVHGNINANQVALNVLRLLKVADRLDIPVYKGVERSLTGKTFSAAFYHGKDGFGDVPDPQAPGPELLQSEHAVQALIRLANENPGEIELICLAPLTNIAIALRLDPELGKKLKHCYMMGGNYEGKGNITATAEFNFFADPEAANVVLEELGCPITMACWELCLKYAFEWKLYDELRSSSSTKSQLLSKIESYQVNKHRETDDWKTFICCDELAMAIAIQPDIVTEVKEVYAKVEVTGEDTRGMVVIKWWKGHVGQDDQQSQNNVRIVMGMKFEPYFQMLKKLVE